MGVSKHYSREREKKRREDSICSQTTKDIARKKAGTSYIEKSTGIL